MDDILKSVVDKYFEQFAPHQKSMAASLQSLQYCEKLINSTSCKTILDSGSGVSSVFFHSRYDNIITVDHDPKWAKTTKEFISGNLKKNIQIKAIETVKDKKFDFVFYDYGDIESRIYYFKNILDMTTKYLYIDDMHIPFFKDYILSRAKGYKLKFLPETLDEFGRFGALLLK